MTTRAEMLELRGGPIRPREIEAQEEAAEREQHMLERKTDEFLALLWAEWARRK